MARKTVEPFSPFSLYIRESTVNTHMMHVCQVAPVLLGTILLP